MKSLISLTLLGLIAASTAVSLPFPPLLHRTLACDDPETEQAAHIAVNYINSHSLHGYKFDLNRIENVKIMPRRPSGEIYSLEMDLLETTCHVMDPTPIENCTVREKTAHAVEGDCDVKLLKLDGQFKVLATKCHSSPDSVEDLIKLCPDCQPLAKLNDVNVMNAVNAALAEYNARNDTNHFYQVLEISRGQHTHLPPASHVEFAIVATNCTAQEAHDHVENCLPMTGEHSHFGFCKATVFRRAIPGSPDVKLPHEDVVNCAVYDHQVGVSHTHLTEHHLGKHIASPGIGHTVLDLIHSHNNTQASHESHSAEQGVVQVAAPVVKRAVAPEALPPPPPLCPGKYRHFAI